MSDTGVNVNITGTDSTAAAVETARSRLKAFNQHVSNELGKVGWKLGDVQKVAGKRFQAVRNELDVPVWREMDSWLGKLKKSLPSVTTAILGIRYGFQSLASIVSFATGPISRFSAQMHELSDRASEAGVKASDIQRLAGAFDELGVKHADLESVTKLFNNLAKNAGASGLDGFKQQMAAISGIADRQERVNELMRIFGKEGARLEFLVRSGPEAFSDALDAAMKNVRGVSDESITAAAEIHKGFGRVAKDVKGMWNEALSKICEWISSRFQQPAEYGVMHVWTKVKMYANLSGLAVKAAFLAAGDALAFAATRVVDFCANVGTTFVSLATGVAKTWQAWGMAWATLFVEMFKSVRTFAGDVARVFVSIGSGIGEVFKQAWNAVTFQDADWSKVGEKFGDVVAKAGEVRLKSSFDGKKVGEAFGNMIRAGTEISFGKWKWSEYDFHGFDETFQGLIEKSGLVDWFVETENAIDEEAEKVGKLGGSFASLGEAGAAAASAFSDAWKGAGAVLGGTYEAFRLQVLHSMGAAGRAVSSARAALRGSSSPASASASPAASQDSKNLSNILARLADLLTVQRDGWSRLERALGAVEAV